MSKWRVYVERIDITIGFIEVEADDPDCAYDIVADMDKDEIADEAEWGSCGDSTEIHVTDEVEKIYEPTVSEVLWK